MWIVVRRSSTLVCVGSFPSVVRCVISGTGRGCVKRTRSARRGCRLRDVIVFTDAAAVNLGPQGDRVVAFGGQCKARDVRAHILSLRELME